MYRDLHSKNPSDASEKESESEDQVPVPLPPNNELMEAPNNLSMVPSISTVDTNTVTADNVNSDEGSESKELYDSENSDKEIFDVLAEHVFPSFCICFIWTILHSIRLT